MMQSLKQYRWWLILLAIIVLVWPFLLFSHSEPIKAMQTESLYNLRGISEQILNYKSAHKGSPPPSLSELVPDSLNGNGNFDLRKFNLQYRHFFKKPTDQYDDNDIAKDTDIVDRYYVLSAIPNTLAYEKPGMWADGSVAVCFDDLTVKRLTSAEFNALGK